MEYSARIEQKISTGNTLYYKICNGTAYHEDTPDEVVRILESARNSGRSTRLRIYYGDAKTGKPWGDEQACYIGRSTGMIKIPLAISNTRSMGGGGILDHCIVKIEHANKKRGGVLYDITKSKK